MPPWTLWPVEAGDDGAGRDGGPLAGDVMLRGLLPTVVGAPVLAGALRLLGEKAGLYSTEVGVFLMVALTLALVLLVASRTAKALNRTDRARRASEMALDDALQELQRSNRELEQFAYVASHDLQEPLRMVTSYLELIERRYKDKLDDDARDFISFAVDGAQRMRNLIVALLAYSRVGTRGQPPGPADAAEALATALQNLETAILQSSGSVQVGRLPLVLADPVQLVQLFQNLVGNALKFRGPAQPRITVGAEPGDGAWTFRVQDNGIGIEARHAERVFGVFQRLHEPGQYPGTGIGLAICRKIVERHGGRIWLESVPGSGTTFLFTLPAIPTEAHHDQAS